MRRSSQGNRVITRLLNSPYQSALKNIFSPEVFFALGVLAADDGTALQTHNDEDVTGGANSREEVSLEHVESVCTLCSLWQNHV